MLLGVCSRFVVVFWTILLDSPQGWASKLRPHLQDHDPNAQYVCKGELGEHAACLCNDAEAEVSCVNAQFVDVHAFHYINTNYRSVRKLTFHGNNFQDLPDAPLFGSVTHYELHTLNISANYIVNLHDDALKSTPNIHILDMSNNEIVLRKDNVNFLSHTPKISQLYLRRAFTSSVNRTLQFQILMQMFENADLKQLKYLDLSYNYLASVPYDLPCPFPSISFLDLRQNMLPTIALNVSCLSAINTIDLSRNYFHELDENFRRNFANYLPPQSLSLKNRFYCDCRSADYIAWIRSTNVIIDKHSFVCARASPKKQDGARILEVPVHSLDCSVSLEAPSASSWNSPTRILLIGYLCSLFFVRR